MARRNRRELVVPGPLGGRGTRQESWRGSTYVVRSVPSAAAVKSYRCPGCDQEVRVGVAHVVVWPSSDLDAGGRRHWHTPCWAARDRRGPSSRRT